MVGYGLVQRGGRSHRHLLRAAGIVAAALLSILGGVASGAPEVVPGEVVVKLRASASGKTASRAAEPLMLAARAYGLLRAETMGGAAGGGEFRRLVFPPSVPVDTLVAGLSAQPGVEYAEPNFVGSLTSAPTDPLYSRVSGDLAHIGVEGAGCMLPLISEIFFPNRLLKNPSFDVTCDDLAAVGLG